MATDRAGYWKPDYSFTDAVAEEARAASRRWWAINDERFPVHPDVYEHWPVAAPEPVAVARTRRGLSKGC